MVDLGVVIARMFIGLAVTVNSMNLVQANRIGPNFSLGGYLPSVFIP